MNGLAEIIRTGHAPGLALKVPDPTSADEAVPRALKQIEQTKPADQIVREMGWKPTKRNINEVRKTWGFTS